MLAKWNAPSSFWLVSAMLLFATDLVGQPVWTDKYSARGVTIDYLSPFFKDDQYLGPTSITFVSGRFPVSRTLRLKPEIPVGYASIEGSTGTENSLVLGNPYIGLEVLGNDGSSTAELGLRLPTIYSETPLTRIAVGADFDRFEAFALETAALTGSFVGRNRSDNVQMEVAGGVTVLVPFNDADTDIYGQYAGQLVFKTTRLGVITGLTGRILFTEGGLSFGQRSTHQAGLSAIGYFGNFRPGVMVRIALDKPLRNLIDAVLGFNLAYEIR
jgi:hypothetical protein